MNLPISKWIQKFERGDFSSRDRDAQIDAGWYDWFCKDTSLLNKTLKLGAKVKQIAKSPKVNVDTMYVFFKNNCPLRGSLYDDFRICDLETGKVIYTVIPRSGYAKEPGKAQVYGRENAFDEPLYEGTWRGLLKWFGV